MLQVTVDCVRRVHLLIYSGHEKFDYQVRAGLEIECFKNIPEGFGRMCHGANLLLCQLLM